MATITTKFDVGDIVWHPVVTTERGQHSCPDCLGTRTWQAISPAGRGYVTPCPRCSVMYQSNSALSLSYTKASGVIRKLTVGQVGWDNGARYMCHETGIGSGSIYSDDNIFATEEQAQEALRGMIQKMDTHIAKDPHWIGKHDVKFSDYQLPDARYEAERGKVSVLEYRIADFLDALKDAETLSEAITAAEDYLKYSGDES